MSRPKLPVMQQLPKGTDAAQLCLVRPGYEGHGDDMENASDFVAELVKAANRVDRLPETTRACLLDISYETIRDMREDVGLPSHGEGQDVAIDMMTMARAVPVFTDAEIASALLEAAAEIRSLHIAAHEQQSQRASERYRVQRAGVRLRMSPRTPTHSI
ncbi:hypothetical protein ACRQ1B_17760 [Rhizobium panacihumi]|uniref:hypothetical protein n=1 Tax=Rhizobium panacihumi TaxID=2008450 RepID=UPI003D79C60C